MSSWLNTRSHKITAKCLFVTFIRWSHTYFEGGSRGGKAFLPWKKWELKLSFVCDGERKWFTRRRLLWSRWTWLLYLSLWITGICPNRRLSSIFSDWLMTQTSTRFMFTVCTALTVLEYCLRFLECFARAGPSRNLTMKCASLAFIDFVFKISNGGCENSRVRLAMSNAG